METKVCTICGLEKPVEEFYFRKKTRKYESNCRKCGNIKCNNNNKAKNRINNPELIKKDLLKKENKKLITKGLKKCFKCEEIRTLDNFRKNRNNYRNECKECENKLCKERNLKNKEHIKQKQQEYRQTHKEQIDKYRKEHYNKDEKKIYNIKYRQEHKDYYSNWHREYHQNYKEELREKNYNWRNSNKDKVKIYQQKDYERRKNDPILRLQRNIRNLLNDSFKKHKYRKSKHAEEILGCKVNDFVLYLLQTFKDNYGYEWNKIEAVHIDHIIPLATAKTEEDVIRLCHYTNLQLLKAKDNLSKNKSLTWSINKK